MLQVAVKEFEEKHRVSVAELAIFPAPLYDDCPRGKSPLLQSNEISIEELSCYILAYKGSSRWANLECRIGSSYGCLKLSPSSFESDGFAKILAEYLQDQGLTFLDLLEKIAEANLAREQ